MKLLDIILEKGKETILEKLKIVQLIEGDVQILIRTLVNQRNKFQIEDNPRIAKYNYRSRLYYSIEDMLLEKRLMCNNSLLNGKRTIHNMTDLKSCYDQQLAEIGSIVQELVGVERLLIKLVTKLLPVMEYYIYISYRASKEFYGRVNQK